MPRTAALGVVDQETRIAFLSLQKRLAVLEKGAFDGSKNLLDNGQKVVNQRGLAALVPAGYVADRWNTANVGVGTTTQNWVTFAAFAGGAMPSGRPTPGFVQFIKMTAAEAAGALAAADQIFERQTLEGGNLQHLEYNTPRAKSVTISFDIWSTVAATLVGQLIGTASTGNRNISKLFTITGGSWQTVALTFPGDTASGLDSDSTGRLLFNIQYVAGSNLTSGTLQTSWGGYTAANSCAGISNTVQATLNNVVATTNLQWEVGSSSTPYEVRSYADELRRCQRYFRRTTVALNGEGAIYGYAGAVGNIIGTSAPFPVPMRAAPTATLGGTHVFVNTTSMTFATDAQSYLKYGNALAAGVVQVYSNSSGYIDFSAEI